MKTIFDTVIFMAHHLEPGNLSSAVKFIMIVLYMPSEKAGYNTLVIAIPTYAEDREQSMTKELYPKVGRRLGVTWKKVEKDIRDVIKKGWDSRDKDTWFSFFPERETPTNRLFISRIADVLELWQELVRVKKMKVQ